MREIIWKTIIVIFLVLWCVLGVHLIIKSYQEGKNWQCSFYAVTEYLLLNLLKDVINIKLDKDKKQDKGGAE